MDRPGETDCDGHPKEVSSLPLQIVLKCSKKEQHFYAFFFMYYYFYPVFFLLVFLDTEKRFQGLNAAKNN